MPKMLPLLAIIACTPAEDSGPLATPSIDATDTDTDTSPPGDVDSGAPTIDTGVDTGGDSAPKPSFVDVMLDLDVDKFYRMYEALLTRPIG